MSASAAPLVSPEEYLALDRSAEIRSEYFNGRMYAMSGGTQPHAMIAANLSGALLQAVWQTDCWVANSDLRLHVVPSGLYTYPDTAVYCGEPKTSNEGGDVMVNPILVAEVLSKSTEGYDRGFKFAQYRLLESLREYVLVSQWEPRVEIFRRQVDGEFKLSECVGIDRECDFTSIGCRIPMSSIYRLVTFPATPAIHD